MPHYLTGNSNIKRVTTFLALPVDETYYHTMRNQQFDLMADLEDLPHAVTWTKKSRLHLTLFFLGEQSPKALQALIFEINQMMDKASQDVISFNATQVQLFPIAKPTVIAFTGACASPLRNLRNNLADCLERASIHPDLSHETEGFLPHITLGKLKEATDLKTQPCKTPVNFTQFALFKSEQTGPCNVTHTQLQGWKLPGA